MCLYFVVALRMSTLCFSSNFVSSLLNSNSKWTVSEEFKTVNRKSRRRKDRKVDLNCNTRYETLYITDSNTVSESEDSDDITITDTSTDNNM